MPNDKEKVIRQLQKELATLARESIEREKQLAKLEAEVIAMKEKIESHTICEQCGRESRLITPERAMPDPPTQEGVNNE